MYGENYGKAELILKLHENVSRNVMITSSLRLNIGCQVLILKHYMNDGSIRTYGTWTGVHTESGKEFALKSYHPMAFKDGKIVGGGDYFDFGGFMASFQ